jgi:hypothetical protein
VLRIILEYQTPAHLAKAGSLYDSAYSTLNGAGIRFMPKVCTSKALRVVSMSYCSSRSSLRTFKPKPIISKLSLNSGRAWTRLKTASSRYEYLAIEPLAADWSSYGLELARLNNAQLYAQQAYDAARRGRVTGPVLQDAQVRLIISLALKMPSYIAIAVPHGNHPEEYNQGSARQ